MRALCPGSFDPVTFGHLDVIKRTSRLFDEVVVAVGRNSTKNYLFDIDERIALTNGACEEFANVRVTEISGLLVDVATELEADVIVKGLRFAADFDFELPMAQLNRSLCGIETLWLPSSPEWGHVSSTMIREVARLGGDVDQFVPPEIAAAIKAKYPPEPNGGS
ncbi:MAG: pantetheine-phosphate adenylyltransferase [Propionibacteriales bacterium]|nr:MAG: pantetheine-phosphate adenylyltransferase [Propionibacteriales bacterium]